MDALTITFESQDIPKFDILINSIPVSYQIIDNQIVLEHDIIFGLNMLKIKLNQGTQVIINDLSLNGVSARHSLYLAFHENPKTNSTWLTVTNRELIIPFGNPMSWWLAECAKKIPNSYYGTNLYEQFDIFYSESLIIDSKFPKLLQDFMKYNFGFHVVDKSKSLLHNKTLPWIKINLDYDENALFTEFSNNIDILKSNHYLSKQKTEFTSLQNQYNKKESANVNFWEVAKVIYQNKFNPKKIINFDPKKLPIFFKLIKDIESLDIEIIHAYIGTVYPGSYVAPHADDWYKHDKIYENTHGPSGFFIPIGWKDGNYFKFNDIGFLPYHQAPFLVNNAEFMHGSINASDTVRFTIQLTCRFTEENIRILTLKN